MKLRLDDNTRSALHFLLLAVGVLGAFRLAYLGFLHITRAAGPDAVALEPWRHGYLLADPYALAQANTTLPERLAWVFLYAIVGGFAIYLLGALIARTLRHADARYPVAAGRISGVMVLLLGMIGALWWPPQQAWLDREAHVWRSVQRLSFPGDLTVPGTEERKEIPFAGAMRIDLGTTPEGTVTLVLKGAASGAVLGTAAVGPDPATDAVAKQAALDALRGHAMGER
ncbi:MAG: hypothetical protein IPK99_14060 [Flavobacteriales bacterium]|nr:hypothetical protein [Flavobacteriales bacterium]